MTTPIDYAGTPTGSLNGAPILGNYQQVISRQSYRGIASLTHGSKYIVFRTNPNSVMWSYKLNTMVENTYGGRVIQVLSTSMEDLRVVIECGMGGWEYAMKVAEFMRNMLVDQRQNGEPGTFNYTTRGWNLKVYAVNVPFQDAVTETTREIQLDFKIQEDVSGVLTSQTISAELNRLKMGIGFKHSQFNTGAGAAGTTDQPPIIYEPTPGIVQTLTPAEIPAVDPFAAAVGNQFSANPLANIPGLSNIPIIGGILGR